jgi:hypothetical protein
LPGRADGYPSGPPTDPYVRNSRIRFLRQSLCYPRKDTPCSAVHGPAGVRVGELNVSPLVPARGTLCPTSPSLPWVPWVSVPHLPWYYATLRLPPCPSRGPSLVARSPIPCVLLWFVVSPKGSLSGRSAQTAPGLLVTRSPSPGIASRRQVALPSSRVPPVKTCPALRPRWCPAHSP